MAVTLADLKEVGLLTLPDAGAQRKLDTASALVERYAPDAPDGVKDEATIRAVGWLLERSPGYASASFGDDMTRFAAMSINVLYHSGATGILTPWRAHGLGKVNDA